MFTAWGRCTGCQEQDTSRINQGLGLTGLSKKEVLADFQLVGKLGTTEEYT